MKSQFLLVPCIVLAATASARCEDSDTNAPKAPPAEAGVTAAPPASCSSWIGSWNAANSSRGQFWISGEYLLGWVQGTRLPPLVTTSPTGTAPAAAGVLGNASTSILFGDTHVNEEVRSGGRIGLGYWFDAERTFGIEASGMILESQAAIFSATSAGDPILARPFFDSSTNQQRSLLVAFPGTASGGIDVRAASGNLYEANVDLTGCFGSCCGFRFHSLVGYRFYRYDEGLRIQDVTNPTNPLFAPGTQVNSVDSFTTSNSFNGGDLGLSTQYTWQNLTVTLRTILSVGEVDRVVKISGSQTNTVPGVAPVVRTGGLFALSTNIGEYHSDVWTVVPELGLDLNWKVRENLRVRFGYTLIGLERFARAADQLDFTVNSNFLPPAGASPAGPAQPAFNFQKANLWVQTLSLGVELDF